MKKIISFILLSFLFSNPINNKVFKTEEKNININSKVFTKYITDNNLSIKKACVNEICVYFDEDIKSSLNKLTDKYFEFIKNQIPEEDYLSQYYKGFVIDKIYIIE